MPPPVVLVHAGALLALVVLPLWYSNLYALSQGRIDTTLCCYRVRSGRKQFRYTGRVEASFSKTEGRSKTRATSAYNNGIVLVVYDRVLLRDEARRLFRLQVVGREDAGGRSRRRKCA
jgi:hypothetical protein